MKKLFLTLLVLLCAIAQVSADDTWTVAGTAAALNGTTDWAPANTDNDMNLVSGTTYQLTVTNCTLETSVTYAYKVVKNHAWGEEYPATSNKTFTVGETAIYTVVYTFNSDTKEVNEEVTKTGEAGAITHTYNIAGKSEALFGTEWDATNTATDMSDEDEDGIYTWEKSDVTLTAGTIEFKVTQDHAWGVSYPDENYQLAIPSDGTYKVTITFNPGTQEVSATAIKKTYSVTFVNGKKWDKVAAYVWNDPDTKIEGEWPGKQLSKTGTVTFNGEELDVYTYTTTETYAPAPEKIIFNNNKSGEGEEKTGDLAFEDGKQYTDAVTFIPVYAVIGSNNDGTKKVIFSGIWDAANTTDLLTEVSDGKWKISFENANLTEAIKFKIIKKAYLEATTVETYYPAGDNLTISDTGYRNIYINFDGTNVSVTNLPATETFSISAEGWATAKATYAVNFTGVEGIEAYTATVSGNTVTLHKVGPVPAGTALVLKGETKEVRTIESADDVSNDLHWYTTYTVNDEHRHVYGLVKTDGKAQFTRVNNGQVITNKAILELDPSASRELKVVFDDETTGISQIENTQPATKTDGAIYNLNGQRVMNPGKGLYIVNGKKVIMK
jgi:hypothetical protein